MCTKEWTKMCGRGACDVLVSVPALKIERNFNRRWAMFDLKIAKFNARYGLIAIDFQWQCRFGTSEIIVNFYTQYVRFHCYCEIVGRCSLCWAAIFFHLLSEQGDFCLRFVSWRNRWNSIIITIYLKTISAKTAEHTAFNYHWFIHRTCMVEMHNSVKLLTDFFVFFSLSFGFA